MHDFGKQHFHISLDSDWSCLKPCLDAITFITLIQFVSFDLASILIGMACSSSEEGEKFKIITEAHQLLQESIKVVRYGN